MLQRAQTLSWARCILLVPPANPRKSMHGTLRRHFLYFTFKPVVWNHRSTMLKHTQSLPDTLVTDNRMAFTLSEFKQFTTRNGI